MRHALSRLLLMVLLVSCVFSAHIRAESAPLVYVALGDSVAYGVGASSPFKTYVSTLFQYLKGPYTGAISLKVNFAQVHETSTSFIGDGQLSNALAQINNSDNDVTVVTLTLGGNDVLNLIKPGQPCAGPQNSGCAPAVAAALRAFAANYTYILQQLVEALNNDPGSERLLVMTYYNPFSGVGGEAAPYEQATARAFLGTDGVVDCTLLNSADERVGLNDLISCIGQFYGATVVDTYPRFLNRGLELTHVGDQPPDIHPTDAGHAEITSTFIRALTLDLYLPIVMQSKS